MQQHAGRRGRAHRTRHLKEGPKDHLGEFVGLGVGHDEEDEGRNEGVLGLQQNVEHLYKGPT